MKHIRSYAGWSMMVILMSMILLVGCGKEEAVVEPDDQTVTNGQQQQVEPKEEEPAAVDQEPAKTEETAEPAEGAASMRLVNTLAGEVEIPVDPQRIVLTYDDDVDHFVALGLKPVSVPVYDRTDNVNGFLPYLADQLEGVTTYPLSAAFEPILAANPDLIVAGYHHRDYLAELQKIAPTIYFEWDVDWRKTHLEMGRVLGLEEKAQANVDAFEAEREKTAAYLAEKIGDEPVAFIRVRQKELELYGAAGTGSSASFILYDLLGLTAVEEAPTDVWGESFSLESFTTLTAEHIFFLVQDTDENNALLEELLSSDLYKNVPAIQKGQVHKVNSYPWERGGPIIFTQGMAQIREMIK